MLADDQRAVNQPQQLSAVSHAGEAADLGAIVAGRS
jgi:hypothetical protein